MKPVNIPSGAGRIVESGLVWQEIYNGAGGTTLYLPIQATFRVSAGASVTVSLDGILAMTLRLGEVELFNTGSGNVPGGKQVAVLIGAGDARIQLAQDSDIAGRRNPVSY